MYSCWYHNGFGARVSESKQWARASESESESQEREGEGRAKLLVLTRSYFPDWVKSHLRMVRFYPHKLEIEVHSSLRRCSGYEIKESWTAVRLEY